MSTFLEGAGHFSGLSFRLLLELIKMGLDALVKWEQAMGQRLE